MLSLPCNNNQSGYYLHFNYFARFICFVYLFLSDYYTRVYISKDDKNVFAMQYLLQTQVFPKDLQSERDSSQDNHPLHGNTTRAPLSRFSFSPQLSRPSKSQIKIPRSEHDII